ncbi:hypothetical protein OZ411_39220 [Bradyrhizobium sp. Arg237L]|uniref:hypothetical protein n=1 Tax=Bradyrhizobium sp. Arg237L TaxID=3003352 RepID=UPI00249DCBF6|nr:hypothetical protein [Bradyrhizobium sp. Arg237L]MDI4238828.1 hypothetical protein [Bradyrhizobium sp. Arg237L]
MLRRMWRDGGAAMLGAVALCLCDVPKLGAMEFLGQAGVLGEWELTGNLIESGSGPRKEFSGPLKMKHVGICTQDGPEERAGEIRLQLAGPDAQVTAEMVLDGARCSYTARKTRAYEGTLSCTGRASVPLLVWLK